MRIRMEQLTKPRHWSFWGLVALMVATAPAFGQDGEHGALKRPAIGGHTFLSSDVVPDPFVRTYVKQSLGMAQAVDLAFPLGVIDGDTLVLLTGDLTFAVLDFEYQHAVKDWLAVRGRFNLRSRLGTSGVSLLAEGLQVTTGFELGWVVRLLESSRVALSATADVSRRSFTVLDIPQFIDDVINDVPGATLSDNIPNVRAGGGLRFAWGVSRLIGLSANLEGGYGDAVRRGDEGDFAYSSGANIDFDFGAVTPVPLGVSVGYHQTSVLDQVDGDSDTRTLVLRLGYTGRPDFMIGVDIVGGAAGDRSLDETVKSVGLVLTTRYYF
jgi:hypothetical protein